MIPVKIIRKSRNNASQSVANARSGRTGYVAYADMANEAKLAQNADYATEAGTAQVAAHAQRASFANVAGDIGEVERRLAVYATGSSVNEVSESTVKVTLLQGSVYKVAGTPQDARLIMYLNNVEAVRVRTIVGIDEDLVLEPTTEGEHPWNAFRLEWTRDTEMVVEQPEIVVKASMKDLFDVKVDTVPGDGGGADEHEHEGDDPTVQKAVSSDLSWIGQWRQGGTGDLTRIEVVRIGKVCFLSGCVQNPTEAANTSNGIFVVPEVFRPSRTVSWVSMGQQWFSITEEITERKAVTYFCQIDKNGKLVIDKLNAGGKECQYQAGKNLFVNGTWTVK